MGIIQSAVQSVFPSRAVVSRMEDGSLLVYMNKYHQGVVSRLLESIGLAAEDDVEFIVFHLPRRRFKLQQYLVAPPAPERLKDIIALRAGQPVPPDTGIFTCPSCDFVIRSTSAAKHAFYAVKVGRRPGVYDDWKTAAYMVAGVKEGSRKGFAKLEDAKAHLSHGKNIKRDGPVPASDAQTVVKEPLYEHLFFVIKRGYRPGVYASVEAAEYNSSNAGYTGYLTLDEATTFYLLGMNTVVKRVAPPLDGTGLVPVLE